MKLLKPQNLDLNALIKVDQYYSYLTNNQNSLGICFKKGKVLLKLVPAAQYFINKIICADEALGNARTREFKRIKVTDVGSVMSYTKMRQVIHLLVQLEIIEVRGVTEFISVQGKQIAINAKYFRLIAPYNGDTELFDCTIKTKQKVNVNKRAKQLIDTSPVIRHQYDLCSNYVFDFYAAEQMINNLYYSKSIDNKKLANLYQYLSGLKNHDIIFTSSEKTNRISTTINCCPKLLRPFFMSPLGNTFTELDFVTFNVQVMVKLIDDNFSISNISDKLIKELDLISTQAQQDFYQHIVQTFKVNGVEISRDTAKDIVLWHWINARNDSRSLEYRIMSALYPEITKIMIALKGETYDSYRKYSCSYMLIESQLTQEIYSEFHNKYPEAVIYNIYDSFMIEKPYVSNLIVIMQDISSKYFNRKVKIKEK